MLIETLLQWNLYNSGDILRTEESVPLIEVFLKERLGKGLLKINQQRIFLISALESVAGIIFKQQNKKWQLTFHW